MLLHVPMDLENFSKPFQYFNHLSKIEGFQKTVSRAWSAEWSGDPMGILFRELKLVKKELVALNKKHGNAHNNVYTARQALQLIQE